MAAKAGDILTLWVNGYGPTARHFPRRNASEGLPTVTTVPIVAAGGVPIEMLGAALRFCWPVSGERATSRLAQSGDQPTKVMLDSAHFPDGILLTMN